MSSKLWVPVFREEVSRSIPAPLLQGLCLKYVVSSAVESYCEVHGNQGLWLMCYFRSLLNYPDQQLEGRLLLPGTVFPVKEPSAIYMLSYVDIGSRFFNRLWFFTPPKHYLSLTFTPVYPSLFPSWWVSNTWEPKVLLLLLAECFTLIVGLHQCSHWLFLTVYITLAEPQITSEFFF